MRRSKICLQVRAWEIDYGGIKGYGMEVNDDDGKFDTVTSKCYSKQNVARTAKQAFSNVRGVPVARLEINGVEYTNE